jgi:DNA-binding NtrC family response regulator
MTAPLPPILFVDDEKNARRAFESMLAAVCADYEVRAVESAEEALKLIAAGDFFMVITDARLNGMSGYDLIREIKTRKPELPVLMITAYATPRHAVEAIQSGAIDYLPKPFEPEQLRHAIVRCASDYQKNQEIAALADKLQHVGQLPPPMRQPQTS